MELKIFERILGNVLGEGSLAYTVGDTTTDFRANILVRGVPYKIRVSNPKPEHWDAWVEPQIEGVSVTGSRSVGSALRALNAKLLQIGAQKVNPHMKPDDEIALWSGLVIVKKRWHDYAACLGGDWTKWEAAETMRYVVRRMQQSYELPEGDPPEFSQEGVAPDEPAVFDLIEYEGHYYSVIAGGIQHTLTQAQLHCGCEGVRYEITMQTADAKFVPTSASYLHRKKLGLVEY